MSKLVSCAVVHDDPPEVFIAEDLETLNWILALKLIARTAGHEIPATIRQRLRSAVSAERWAEAVSIWMEIRPGNIDVYESHDLFDATDVVLAAEELQFSPLFHD